jgi:hypothetical protein
MTFLEALSYGLSLGVGSLILLISLLRVPTTVRLRRQLLQLADSLWREGIEANQTSDQTLVKIHNMLIETAALAPAIASGVVDLDEDQDFSESDRRETGEFLNRNAWVIPYVGTGGMILARLLFHARPWSPRRAIDALAANMLMWLVDRNSGAINYVNMRKSPEDQMKKFAQLDTKPCSEAGDRFVRA